MKMNDVFPSNFLKSEDLQGREVNVIINTYKMETVGSDNRLVIYFKGKEKGFVCNKTNADRIAHYYSDDLDNWIGKGILLGTELVTFQGKTSEAIRVKGKAMAPSQAAQAPQPVQATQPFDEPDSEGIPF
jgi:hypothetical protein